MFTFCLVRFCCMTRYHHGRWVQKREKLFNRRPRKTCTSQPLLVLLATAWTLQWAQRISPSRTTWTRWRRECCYGLNRSWMVLKMASTWVYQDRLIISYVRLWILRIYVVFFLDGSRGCKRSLSSPRHCIVDQHLQKAAGQTRTRVTECWKDESCRRVLLDYQQPGPNERKLSTTLKKNVEQADVRWELSRAHESFRPNTSESLNFCQL